MDVIQSHDGRLRVHRYMYSFSFRCVDQFDVLQCISSVKSNAIGSDDLDLLFLKILAPRFLPFYIHLFNTVLTKSTFPDEWKLAKVLPIPKTNNEFRPIAILPFLSKVMKDIIVRQINSYLESYKYLTVRQSAFMKGKSCTTALLNVVENLRLKLDKNSVSFFVLFNRTKAFDIVNHITLLNKLLKLSNSAGNLIFLIC